MAKSIRERATPLDPPPDIEAIETALLEVAAAMKKLGSTRLKKKVLVTLIADDTRMGKTQVETVLNSLESIEENYLKPKEKTQ